MKKTKKAAGPSTKAEFAAALKKAEQAVQRIQKKADRLNQEMIGMKISWANAMAERSEANKELTRAKMSLDGARLAHTNSLSDQRKLQGEIVHYRDAIEGVITLMLRGDDGSGELDPESNRVIEGGTSDDRRPWHLRFADEMEETLKEAPTVELTEGVNVELLERQRFEAIKKAREELAARQAGTVAVEEAAK